MFHPKKTIKHVKIYKHRSNTDESGNPVIIIDLNLFWMCYSAEYSCSPRPHIINIVWGLLMHTIHAKMYLHLLEKVEKSNDMITSWFGLWCWWLFGSSGNELLLSTRCRNVEPVVLSCGEMKLLLLLMLHYVDYLVIKT